MGEQLVAMGRSLGTAWTAGRRIERAAYVVSAILFASGVLHVAVFFVDGGPWEG
ncbi:MAG: hypothetical protein QOD39_3015, partial [Mycobacterium sp.]|nr:hypothetical protein [Mycobacterium sp.]